MLHVKWFCEDILSIFISHQFTESKHTIKGPNLRASKVWPLTRVLRGHDLSSTLVYIRNTTEPPSISMAHLGVGVGGSHDDLLAAPVHDGKGQAFWMLAFVRSFVSLMLLFAVIIISVLTRTQSSLRHQSLDWPGICKYFHKEAQCKFFF